MLVDHFSAECRTEIEGLAARDHRVGEREGLTRGEPAKIDGHAERRELIVGDLPARVAENQLGDLARAELLPVSLALDELCGPDQAPLMPPPCPRRASRAPSRQATR